MEHRQRKTVPDRGLNDSAALAAQCAQKLLELRTNTGKTQKQLATRLRMTESMISRLERGDHVPSLKTLCRIADAFGPGSFHGPELQRIATEEGTLEISIFETGVSPRFRLSGVTADTVTVQTHQGGDERQDFSFANRGTYWESVEQIREPHQFALSVIINHGGHAYRYEAQFTEHGHEHGDVYGH